MTDNTGEVWAPLPVAPVNATARVLVPQGRRALQQGATQAGFALQGASVHLEGGCDTAHHRAGIFKAGMIPHIPEHPRHRQPTQRGRKRLCTTARHA